CFFGLGFRISFGNCKSSGYFRKRSIISRRILKHEHAQNIRFTPYHHQAIWPASTQEKESATAV
ncbi:hypothetical protein ACTHSL_13100, partial [Neisseria sp. P0008.S010]